MRRSFFTLSFHYRDTGPYLIIRYVQAKLVPQRRSEFDLVLQYSSFGFTRRVPHSQPCIEHCNPRPVGAGSRGYDIALVGRIRVRSSVRS